jgi:hypothetical protein
VNVDEFFASIEVPETWRVLEKWDEYLEMVRWIEADGSNQSGSDKSWVESAARRDREFFENVQRVD